MTRLATYVPLVASLLLVATSQSTTISVPSTEPNSSFYDYFCGNHSSEIVDNSVVVINADMIHDLSRQHFCVVRDLENITIQSSGEREATIRCNGGSGTGDLMQSGIGFLGIRNLTIRYIRFENCGGVIKNTMERYEFEDLAPPKSSTLSAINDQQQAVLLFSNCTDVTLDRVTIESYRGYAIFAINLYETITLHTVIVKNSFATIQRKTSSTRSDVVESGSGIYFYFMDTDSEPVPGSEQTLNSRISIQNSEISKNFNIYPDSYYKVLRTRRIQNHPMNFTLPGAGGLTVMLMQQTFHVSLMVENTVISNNGGSTSGGVLLLTRNTVNNMDMIFNGCIFFNNSIQDSKSVVGGGGIQLILSFSFAALSRVNATAGMVPSEILVENSTFQNNYANRGAAIAILNEAQNVSVVRVALRHVSFIDNDATMEGDCIEARSEDSAYYAPRGFNVEMESIKVWHSAGQSSSLDNSYALSFINVDRVSITGTEDYPTNISNGHTGGMFTFASNIYFSGHVKFDKNCAKYGGALSLHANSYLFFMEQSQLLFSNNNATKGGAIFSDSLSSEQCLMQFIEDMANYTAMVIRDPDDLEKLVADFNITFIDNIAADGNSIYALPIYNCSWYSESVIQLPTDKGEAVYQTLFHFQAGEKLNETYLKQIRSYPDKPCFCSNVTDPQLQLVRFDIRTFPGKSFNINVVPVDVVGQPLSSIVISEILGDMASLRDNRQSIADKLNGRACTAMNYTLYKVENVTVSIQLSIPNTVNAIYVNVELLKCPFGFQLNPDTGSCDCDAVISRITNSLGNSVPVTCSIETGQIIKPTSSWIGPTQFGDDTEEPPVGYAQQCPVGYCQNTDTISFIDIDNISSSESDIFALITKKSAKICIGNRTGEICGRCLPNQSSMFGTSNCGYCSNYWLFTIFLYALAGIVLIIILFLLKLNITSGALSGVIIYAQFFSINQGLLLQASDTRFATIFISLLNLELGFPMCFYYGMTLIGKLGLQFVFPVYLWVLVAVITYFSRYSNTVAQLVGSESVKVFVTLIYLSYTKLLRTVFTVFIPNFLETEDGTHVVWFFDGSTQFLRGGHLGLGLLSFVFLVFIIAPYKFFILLAQWSLKSSRISKRYKPLIDANLAPFKDRWRFWFGMRLFVIAFLLLLATVLIGKVPLLVTFIDLVTILLLLTLQAHIKPYKSKIINILDLFFLTNFALFLAVCLYILPGTDKQEDIDEYYEWIEIVFVGSAFLVFIGIVIYHIVERVKEFLQYLKRRQANRKPKVTTTEVSIDSSIEDDSIQSTRRSRLPSQHRAQVTITTLHRLERSDSGGDRLRESLLDNST